MAELRAARERAERVASHYGFAFFIASGTRYEYAGWKSEDRPATEEEEEMWRALDALVPESPPNGDDEHATSDQTATRDGCGR